MKTRSGVGYVSSEKESQEEEEPQGEPDEDQDQDSYQQHARDQDAFMYGEGLALGAASGIRHVVRRLQSKTKVTLVNPPVSQRATTRKVTQEKPDRVYFTPLNYLFWICLVVAAQIGTLCLACYVVIGIMYSLVRGTFRLGIDYWLLCMAVGGTVMWWNTGAVTKLSNII